MDNIIAEIGEGIDAVGKNIVKEVEIAKSVTEKTAAILAIAIKDQPELKTAIVSLISLAEKVIVDSASATAAKGFNLTQDAVTVADVESCFAYFTSTFIPLVESIYSDVKTELATS